MSKSKSTGPGGYRLFRGHELLTTYPEFQGAVNGFSLSLELTNFDIGADDLKWEHDQGIWRLALNAFDKRFTSVHGWGYHSHTGDAKFNLALAERRAQNAVSRAVAALNADTRAQLNRRWVFRPVAWRRGMKDGESPEMRKVLILFHGYPVGAPPVPVETMTGAGKVKTF